MNKLVVWTLIAAIGLGSITFPTDMVQAEEVMQEYVVMANNDTGYNAIKEVCGIDTTEDSLESEVLEENHIAIVEMTEAEASELEVDKNILFVEEDIPLSGSDMIKRNKKKTKTVNKEQNQQKAEQKEKKKKLWEEREKAEETAEVTGAEYGWNLQAIHADEVLEHTQEDTQKIKVAVLDSGIDYVSGIDLEGYVNFVDEDEISPIYQDMTGHGTGIASIIAGNGETGIYGVNPNVELYSVKIMDEENIAPLSRVIRGIYWCIENNVDIINMSFGTSRYSQVLEQAVKDAYDAGILMVAAAGNENSGVEYPAAFAEVMAVAATNPEAEISDFSNEGEELDIAAPGEKIRVASYFDGSVVTHGTSIAVPHVVGVASLLWEKDVEKSHEFIRQLISYSAKDIVGTDDCGLLDAEYALSIYDTFAQNFEEGEAELEENVPVNEEEPECFEEVNVDENYVEGRWNAAGHESAVNDASGYTAAEINLIKKGCVFPDHKYDTLVKLFGTNVQFEGTTKDWQGAAKNPRWHGKWRREAGYLTNYVTICELVTDIALHDGNVDAYSVYSDYGLDQWTYNVIREEIAALNIKKVLSTYGYSNTAKNRKYFLYGCAIHTITDVFAHSAAKKVNGEYVRIEHTINGVDDGADSTSVYEDRHNIACKIGKYALQNLKDGVCTDGYEVNQAIHKVLNGKTPKFRIIDIKRNIVSNGHSSVCNEVTKVNIESSQTKTAQGKWAN